MLLILGNGILGSSLAQYCTQMRTPFLQTTRDTLDITQPIAKIDESILKLIGKEKITAIINTIGFTKVDLCEEDKHNALAVNSYGPAKLANICSLLKIHLIHISTDFVFDGKHTLCVPYREEDVTSPINFYGYSKLLGEKFIKESGCKYSILRTSKLYNATSGFIHKILKNIRTNKSAYAIRHQYFSPTHANSLACQIVNISVNKLYGTYHTTCWGHTSAYDLITFILSQLGITMDVEEIPLFTHFTGAQRPEMCVLSSEKLQAFGVYTMPSWQEALIPVLQKEKVEWEFQKSPNNGSLKT